MLGPDCWIFSCNSTSLLLNVPENYLTVSLASHVTVVKRMLNNWLNRISSVLKPYTLYTGKQPLKDVWSASKIINASQGWMLPAHYHVSIYNFQPLEFVAEVSLYFARVNSCVIRLDRSTPSVSLSAFPTNHTSISTNPQVVPQNGHETYSLVFARSTIAYLDTPQLLNLSSFTVPLPSVASKMGSNCS